LTEKLAKSQQDGGTKPEAGDAATLIYPGAKRDRCWDMEQLCDQVSKKAIPIFKHLHPNLQAVFIFDCSLAHSAFAKNALRVQNMNLGSGGKQSHLRDSIIPSDDLCIPEHLCSQPQSFVFDSLHPDPTQAGKAKGFQVILEEHGLWQHYTSKTKQEGKPALNLCYTNCATSNIQKDALEQSARLVQQAEDAGYFLTQEASILEILPSNTSLKNITN